MVLYFESENWKSLQNMNMEKKMQQGFEAERTRHE
jgi:hypothetical protein